VPVLKQTAPLFEHKLSQVLPVAELTITKVHALVHSESAQSIIPSQSLSEPSLQISELSG
jgi:hypothetical protein